MIIQSLKVNKGIFVGFVSRLSRSRIITQNMPLLTFFSSSVLVTKFQSFVLPDILSQASWTIFLQSSLILAIWSNFDKLKISNLRDTLPQATFYKSTSNQSFSQKKIITMAIAFLFGTIGSCLGAYIGYILSIFYLQIRYKNFTNIPFELIIQLKMIASCVASSYIGGTANFFETNQVLINSIFSYDKQNIRHKYAINKSSLKLKTELTNSLNAVAGIDIIVMIAYFSILTFIQQYSKKMANRTTNNILEYNTDYSVSKWRSKHNRLNEDVKRQMEADLYTYYSQPSRYNHYVGYKEKYNTNYSLSKWREKLELNEQDPDEKQNYFDWDLSNFTTKISLIYENLTNKILHNHYLIKPFLLKYITPLLLALSICIISLQIQNYIYLPGTSVMISLIISILLAEFFVNRMAVQQKASAIDNENIRNKVISLITNKIKNSCAFLSEMMLLSFYLLIGFTSKLTDILKAGFPALILISTFL